MKKLLLITFLFLVACNDGDVAGNGFEEDACEADLDQLLIENDELQSTIEQWSADVGYSESIIDQNKRLREQLEESNAIIDKQLVDSHIYRDALIDCGCSMEGQ